MIILLAICLTPSVLVVGGIAVLAAWDCVAGWRHRDLAPYAGKLAVVPPPPSLESIQACEELWALEARDPREGVL